ncbi:MAG TPA: HAMP domain-containing sensor histidine kinase [Myxococcales bacterium]
MKLSTFIGARRDPIVRRWIDAVRAELRSEEALDETEILDSLRPFLDELIRAMEQDTTLPGAGRAVAAAHGAQRQVLQRDVADMVREYGLLFRSVTDEAVSMEAGPFQPGEYARLASCLARGASEAVREYTGLHALELRRQAWEHFAFLAHEIRSPLQTARLSAQLIRSGAPQERGMQVLERSLAQLAESIDHALVDARLRGIDAGASLQLERVELAALISRSVEEARPDADAREISLRVEAQPPLPAKVDQRVLRSAIGNLVRNAVKFTRTGGKVTVRARPGSIEVEDECGGVRPEDEAHIFEAFRQAGDDRSGFGLGLAIARAGIEAHGGKLSVRNLPGTGCVFAVSLPAS